MNIFTILSTMLFSFSVCASPSILNGRVVTSDHSVAKSTVALLQEKNGKTSPFCSGTVLGPRLVISAAHCIGEWDEGRIFIGSGENPLLGKLTPVKSVKIMYDSGELFESEDGDIALLLTEETLDSLLSVRIGDPSELTAQTNFLQAGYGFNTEDESETWPYFGKLLMETNAVLGKMTKNEIAVEQKLGTGVLGGDSGGPLFTQAAGKLILHGVLSTGGAGGNKAYAGYTHPYFALEWMNCALAEKDRVVAPGALTRQILCDGHPFIKMEDLSTFTKKLCEERNPGWSIRNEPSCWPATEAACRKHSEHTQEELNWDPVTERCLIPE